MGPTQRTAPTPPDDPIRRRRQGAVLAGLALSFIGLLLIGGLLPTAPAALGHALPIAAAGLFGIWLGGILLGNASRPLWRGGAR